jgi:hypothetical protein
MTRLILKLSTSFGVFRNMVIGTLSNLLLLWLVINPESNINKMQKIDEITDIVHMSTLIFDKPLVTMADKGWLKRK